MECFARRKTTGTALPDAAVDQHPGRLLLHPPRTAGLEDSGDGLQTGQGATAMPAQAAHPVRDPESAPAFFGVGHRGVHWPRESEPEGRTAGFAQIGTEKRSRNLATLARRSIQGYEDVGGGREYRSGPRLAGCAKTQLAEGQPPSEVARSLLQAIR